LKAGPDTPWPTEIYIDGSTTRLPGGIFIHIKEQSSDDSQGIHLSEEQAEILINRILDVMEMKY
jgi:hypothetical protein